MEKEKTGPEKRKYDILQHDAVASIIKNRKTQFLFQIPLVMFLILAVLAGFFGIQSSNRNPSTISIWVIWWSLLIISLALFGRLWCFMCPFGTIGDWIQRRTFYKKVNDTFTLNIKWPAKFRNLSLAAMLFLVITWADFHFNLVNSPMNTAYFMVALLGLVAIISIIFERRSFCRYACPITGLIGIYSMFAPFELRVKEKGICKTCKEKYCISGNENGYGCPVFEYPGAMDKNNYCILCMECVKTCHFDEADNTGPISMDSPKRNNISLNIRSFAGDLWTMTRTRTDEAIFILILLGVTIFQTLAMIRPWSAFTRDLMSLTGLSYDAVRFILFISIAVIPLLIYSIAIAFLKLVNRNASFKNLFTCYAYPIIPLGLMMLLSHNIRHLLEEGTAIFPVLSDPFGFGWDIFGVSGYAPAPLFNNGNILLIQWLFLFTGLGFSILIGKNISRRIFHGYASAYFPILIFIFTFFVFNLWMIGQPIMHKH